MHTTVTANRTARLFLHHIWKLHELPRSVVLDKGPQFIAEFMQELYRMLDIIISSSTAYHPQTDGQTERVNQELEQYLRVFISERQDDWAELLPMAEFQHNNHIHSATQTTLFLLDSSRALRMGFESHTPSQVEIVNEFVEHMKSTTDVRGITRCANQHLNHYTKRVQCQA